MDENTNITKNTILEALSLNPTPTSSSGNEENISLPCMFCEHFVSQDFPSENKDILKHMYMEHRLVIADIQDVHDLKGYLEFWKNEFKGQLKV